MRERIGRIPVHGSGRGKNTCQECRFTNIVKGKSLTNLSGFGTVFSGSGPLFLARVIVTAAFYFSVFMAK